MQLEMVISGGQTGADVAGVDAALACGLRTGGWMPKDWMTLEGPRPEYADKYRMLEHEKPGYPPRTIENVKDSDATLILGFDLESRGVNLTFDAAIQHVKPVRLIRLHTLQRSEILVTADWLMRKSPRVLNVAGNRETDPPTVYQPVYEFLVDVFKRLQR